MFKRKIENTVKVLTKEDLLKLIDVNTEIVVVAPWNGAQIPVTIKMLDSVALTSCGVFNSISAIVDPNTEEAMLEDILKVKNIHENMLKLALVRPSFKELETHLMGKDFYKNNKKEIKEIEALISQLDSEIEKEEYREQLHKLELASAYILPEDFTGCIVTILMQQQATDINKLTKETLLQAGFLAEKYNVRPSDYLQGTFTDKQKVDIDLTALTLVFDYRESQKVEQNGMKWLRGKNNK